ncbi:hypothetical protein [uncultured Roseobacter sp.]|uniref:hypothetical protein n=1 Tax=uncultured Roseobacter sp. TaxID=114847 RepID=UPI002616BB6D|nr:hypothetical protein [uncultured Roseobacter sp.]
MMRSVLKPSASAALLLVGALTPAALSQTFACSHPPGAAEQRRFSAKITIARDSTGLSAQLGGLQLSAAWPLPAQCDTPLRQDPLHLEAVEEDGALKLGPANEQACGFTLYIDLAGDDPALLAPRRSYRVFGEAPFLARCEVE